MKIALFSDTFPPQVNGVANVVASSARALAERGHEVRVFTASGESADTLRKIAKGAYTIYLIPSLPFWGFPDLRMAVAFGISIRRLLRGWRPDVVHTHTLFGVGNLAVRTARYCHVPLIGTHHTFFNHYLKYIYLDYPWAQRFSWRYTINYYNRCQLLISPSQALAAELKDNGLKQRVEIVPNAVDTDHFCPDPTKKTNQSCIYMGRLGYEKSVDQVLRAFKQVVTAFPQATLTIVGDGPERRNLEQLCVDLNISRAVRFAGFCRGQALVKELQHHQLFLTASKTENMPLSVLEAMATGLPVVAVRAKGLPEIVHNGVNGLLVTPDSPEKMAAAIQLLFTDEATRACYAQAARLEALTYSPKTITDRLEAIYAKTA